MSSSDESERRLAEALRARATGAGRPGPPGLFGTDSPTANPFGGVTRMALLIALLGGVVLGCGLALLSLLFPGVLPAIG